MVTHPISHFWENSDVVWSGILTQFQNFWNSWFGFECLKHSHASWECIRNVWGFQDFQTVPYFQKIMRQCESTKRTVTVWQEILSGGTRKLHKSHKLSFVVVDLMCFVEFRISDSLHDEISSCNMPNGCNLICKAKCWDWNFWISLSVPHDESTIAAELATTGLTCKIYNEPLVHRPVLVDSESARPESRLLLCDMLIF